MGNVFLLEREILTGHSTAGKLYEPDGTLICDTLEDTDRDLNPDGDWKSKKIYGDTAIPCGFYEIKMQFSPHFKEMMPYLQDVKTHQNVMLHWGTKVADTLGCPLVGKRIADDALMNSRVTYREKFIPVLARYLAAGDPVFLQVRKSDSVIDKRNVIK